MGRRSLRRTLLHSLPGNRLWTSAHRAGFTWVRHKGGGPLTVYRYRLPTALRWAGVGGRLELPVDKVTTAVGFSYAPGGWHPHAETLRRLADASETPDPGDTPLGRLYAAFQPRTVQEAICDDRGDPIPGLHDIPLVRGQLRELWNPHRARPLKPGQTLDRPGLYWGPAAPEYTLAEIGRTLAVYRSMREVGIRQDGLGKDAITGYLLVRGDDYRFVLHQGHHRLAALAALGHERVYVCLSPRQPPVVDLDDLERWTGGARARYSPESARLLFTRLFEATGLEKALRLGLVDRRQARLGDG